MYFSRWRKCANYTCKWNRGLRTHHQRRKKERWINESLIGGKMTGKNDSEYGIGGNLQVEINGFVVRKG